MLALSLPPFLTDFEAEHAKVTDAERRTSDPDDLDPLAFGAGAHVDIITV